MTKRTFHYITESCWLLLAIMPIILYLCMGRTGGGTLESFMTVMTEKLNFINTDNVIYTTIKGVFGSDGTLPIMNDGLILYATYFCVVELVHLIVDVIIWIPRLAQEWLTAFQKKIGG